MTAFDALLLSKSENGQTAEWARLTEEELMDGDVTVRVSHSTINYKDGLAITGQAPVVRRWPMIPGIDFAGTVVTSSHPEFKQGDEVLINGWGLGETHYGGYAQMARVKGDWLLPVPAGLARADCMALGTAGYTAMLCVMALEKHDVTPEKGPVLVTGAAGGVGSVAVALLARLGYQVAASTGRQETADYLRSLGASEILPREELSAKPRAAGEGTLGGRDRRRRQQHAGECAVADEVWRHGRGLRTGPGDGPERECRALHSALRDARRNRFGHGAETEASGGVGAPRPRSRSRQASRDDGNPLRPRCGRARAGDPGGTHSRANRFGGRVSFWFCLDAPASTGSKQQPSQLKADAICFRLARIGS